MSGLEAARKCLVKNSESVPMVVASRQPVGATLYQVSVVYTQTCVYKVYTCRVYTCRVCSSIVYACVVCIGLAHTHSALLFGRVSRSDDCIL